MNRESTGSIRTASMVRNQAVTIITLLCLSVFGLQCNAQSSTAGTINGTVADQSGALVTGAKVTIINEGTHSATQTVTNSNGGYSVVGLPSGNYEVSVEVSGFAEFRETGIYLEPAATYTVSATMKPGGSTVLVTVEASAVALQTTTSEISSTVSGEEMHDLPMNGRDFESVAQAMPGVVNLNPDTGQSTGGPNQNNTINVNGAGENGTFYMLDGIWDENTGDMTQITIQPNPDEIAELKVLQNNYDAKYALMGGNVMLIQTKNGSSAFHGDAWEFNRNTVFDSRNFFVSPSTGIQPEGQNIFGWDLGGPAYIPRHYNARKDKLFFYANQQWARLRAPSVTNVGDALASMRAPTTDAGAVIFPSSGVYGYAYIGDPKLPPNNCNATSQSSCFPKDSSGNYEIPVSRINTANLALLNAMAPPPNNQGTAFNNYTNTHPVITSQLDQFYKFDYYFTPNNRFSGEWAHMGQLENNPSALRMGSDFPTDYDVWLSEYQNAQLQFASILSPTMTNQVGIAFNHLYGNHIFGGTHLLSQVPGFSEQLPFSPAQEDQSAYLGGALGDYLPQIAFSGNGGGWNTFGTSINNVQADVTDQEIPISDDWSWLRGKHFFEAGFNIVIGNKRQGSGSSEPQGEATFNGNTNYEGATPAAVPGNSSGDNMVDFLLGNANVFTQGTPQERKFIEYVISSPYVEDQVKVTRRLTITAGIRYLHEPFPKSQLGYTTVFIPALFAAAAAPTVSTSGILTATTGSAGNPNTSNLNEYANGIALNGKTTTNGSASTTLPLNVINQNNSYWAPTFGFALDVFGNGRSSLRGGYGITYNRSAGMGAACAQSCVGVPDTIQLTYNNVTFPNVTGGTIPPASVQSASGMDPSYKIAKFESYSLSWQQQLGGDWFVQVAGAGDIANNLSDNSLQSYNINQPLPTTISGVSYNFNPAINTGTNSAYYAPYQGFSSIAWYGPWGIQRWNALEVSVRHPQGHHLYMTLAYTWSHNLDNTGPTPQNAYNLAANYGNASDGNGANTPQVFVASLVYTLPVFRSGLKQYALGGWKFADETTIQSGSSAQIGLGGSSLGLATRPNQIAPLTYSKQWKPYEYGSNAFWFNPGTPQSPVFQQPAQGYFGTLGTGTELGPGVNVSNMAIFKEFPIIQERLKFEFRAEYFNVFNHTNPNGPGLTFQGSNFGVITSAKDPRLGQMSARIVF
jgi:hypothetical protein